MYYKSFEITEKQYNENKDKTQEELAKIFLTKDEQQMLHSIYVNYFKPEDKFYCDYDLYKYY